MSDYRENGLKAYGNKCEWIGCGWDAADCDAHHINYQEHQMVENGLRAALKTGSTNMREFYENRRKELNFGAFDTKTKQLPKDDRSTNIAMICPNHHRYVHTEDLGMEILKYIPPRKSV